MSGGLPSDDPWADREEAITDAAFDEVLRAGVQFAWVPGTTFEYSNLGYTLLGRAIQVAARRRFHDLVVASSSSLSGSGRRRSPPTSPLATAGHRPPADRRRRLGAAPVQRAGRGVSSIGGLFGTVTDLARWVQFFVDARPR